MSFPDRVDFPFITEPGVAAQRVTISGFGQRNWGAGWQAWRVLADFSQTNWRDEVALPHWTAVTSQTVEQEILDLQEMARDERADALGELFSQHEEFMTPFITLMGGKPSTHQASMLVLKIANLAATMVAMHYKGHYNRPRPSQICPALYPPIEVPDHAAYPSGHATQARIFAICCRDMLPATQAAQLGPVLDAMAVRIARNREIAGLHYPSDSEAGRRVAAGIFRVLTDDVRMSPGMGAPSKFRVAMDHARTEWSF